MEHQSDGDTNVNWCFWYDHHGNGVRIGGIGNKRTTTDHPDYGIVKIGQNTEQSPRDLRKLAVIQSPERNHNLTLM